MKNATHTMPTRLVGIALLLAVTGLQAQVPVDDDGNVIGDYASNPTKTYSSEAATGNEGIPLLSPAELEELVGPVALYPDDLLAVVLPASTYPLQVVQAARFLEDLESDPSLEPDPDWDDSIVALINYPEVVELLNEDLDWTWRLGEAVVAQQADVVSAVESFRNRAYAAGNLKSDEYQTVSRDEGIIEIVPVNEEIIYVPYYEPARVVYYQPRPVYFYYPRPCPVYYYPYPSHYAFRSGFFWGVTTAFTIGWHTDHLRVFHHSYRGHPYYGVRYWDRWWYRRPTIHVHNNVYINNSRSVSVNRHRTGDFWRSSRDTRLRVSDQRITRSTHYPNNGSRRSSTGSADVNRTVTRTPLANVTRQSNAMNERRIVERNDNDARRETRTSTRERQSSSTRSGSTSQREQRPTVDRNSTQRRTWTSQRQTTVREPVRNVSERRSEPPMPTRQAASNRTRSEAPVTTHRQTTQRQTTQRSTTQRQTTQRQSTQRQSTQRSTSQRQTTQRQTTAPNRQPASSGERRSSSSSGSQSGERRSKSSSRAQSQRESSRRR